jgi:predicted ATPase
LKGEILIASQPASAAEADSLFSRALEIARAQEAKSFELRVASSLARLWRRQGKSANGRALLGAVYAGFTEGFDTRDLIEAKALLQGLQ